MSIEEMMKCRSIDPATGCWNWTRGKNADGYGQVRVKGFSTCFVSRIAFILFKGPLEKGTLVLRTCDNPPCFNPDHLFAGTNAQNQADMVSKGRCGKRGLNRAKVSPNDVLKIREMVAAGDSQTQVGRLFGLCQSAVHRIVKYKNWRAVVS